MERRGGRGGDRRRKGIMYRIPFRLGFAFVRWTKLCACGCDWGVGVGVPRVWV